MRAWQNVPHLTCSGRIGVWATELMAFTVRLHETTLHSSAEAAYTIDRGLISKGFS